ncbi:MAG: glycerol-3-phosphate 1-O-acyltransferase PlsY [Longimicrobiales bacterium]
MRPLALLLASYLVGAVPSSYIAGRLTRGLDLRRQGSGNLGATNTFRVLGWRIAVPVLVFDLAKGWFPVYFFPRWDGTGEALWALGYAAAAVIGHVFSVYVGFRGGKGVATSAGALLALTPIAVCTALVLWTVIVVATRLVSLGSIVAAAVIPLIALLEQGPTPVFWLAAGLAVFVIWAHRANLARLLRGEEQRLGTLRRRVT